MASSWPMITTMTQSPPLDLSALSLLHQDSQSPILSGRTFFQPFLIDHRLLANLSIRYLCIGCLPLGPIRQGTQGVPLDETWKRACGLSAGSRVRHHLFTGILWSRLLSTSLVPSHWSWGGWNWQNGEQVLFKLQTAGWMGPASHSVHSLIQIMFIEHLVGARYHAWN